MARLRRLWFASLCSALAAQSPAPSGAGAKPKPQDRPRVHSIEFDADGWPIGVGDASPAPGAESAPARRGSKDGQEPRREPARTEATRPGRGDSDAPPTLASGMQLGSPLLDIYQATQPPGAWKQIGGVVVWWRLTVYGSQGEEIGVREVTHTADVAFAERDRLELADGRVYGRLGPQIYAERNGMPMPTLGDDAAAQLLLFGMQLRLCWAFGDANAYTVVGKDVEERGGERFRRVVVEQRLPSSLDQFGLDAEAKPRDHYEVLYEPSSGEPRELVHRFAASLQTRRVRLEEWREWEGVRLPFRRVYVDEAMRPTTMLEILRLERQRTSERDFRLL